VTPKDLADRLSRLLEYGGNSNRLVVKQDHAFFVARGSKGGGHVELEAAAAFYLPKDRRPSAEQVNELRRRGFAPHPPARGLRRRYALSELRRAGDEMTALFRGVYGAEGTVTVREELGDADHTTNPRLLEAMKAAAKKRDQSSRFALYRAFMASTLMVPLDDGQLEVVGDLGGFEVFGCFTDAQMAERYDPRGVELLHVRGRRLVNRLLERKVGSLLINPGGTIRGELYRTELESIANAMRPSSAVAAPPGNE